MPKGVYNHYKTKGHPCYGGLMVKGHKLRKGIKKDNVWNWKGEKVSYSGLHHWLKREKGTPTYCEICGSTGKRKYQWANIDHKYRRVLEDYISMCVPCHRKYDYKNHLSNIGSGSGSIKNKI